MMNIRPVSDLLDKFPEVEDIALRRGEAVFLTKEGYGHLVLMSLERYEVMAYLSPEERGCIRKKIEELGVLKEEC